MSIIRDFHVMRNSLLMDKSLRTRHTHIVMGFAPGTAEAMGTLTVTVMGATTQLYTGTTPVYYSTYEVHYVV